MSVLILDPMDAKAYLRRHRREDGSRFDECWNGRVVVPPLPNSEHQQVQFLLGAPFLDVVIRPGLGQVFNGVNVSDRAKAKWTKNYRGPDLLAYLAGNPAIDHGTHWQGGPDFLVEILSRGERPKAKFGFYARINTREVLLVHRKPWALELYRLRAGRLEPAGRSDLVLPAVLTSCTLPLTFHLVAGTPRPQILVTHSADGRTWLV